MTQNKQQLTYKKESKKTGIFKNFQPKKAFFVVLFSLLFYMLIGAIFSKITINISDSHQGAIFWKSDKKPQIGDYVYFDFKHQLLLKNIETLSKKLVCKEQQYLIIDDNFITCNNKKYKIKRKNKTGSGKKIEQFYYQGIVPNGRAIVWGENLESFDSRYWGFIDYSKLNTMILIF